ncbi:Golgi membrane protein 1 [Ascaphus truei]|uniref:Golgi membrane protein 1 n=1 Tax=Ascaphus truei TaxID=8439 RepID=UPI003F5A5469
MMGLGNGRRGIKSPPFLVAVLLACVFVLGINYWITSSRCVELQSRVVELEGRMRRAAAERGAVEMKKNEFEDKLEKQREQIDNIQAMHSSRIQNVNKMYNNEKEGLLSNITMKERFIQSLQGQLRSHQKSLGKLQLEFEHLQESQAKKSFFELAQCSNKMKELSEQCEEKLRKATGKGENVSQNKEVGIIENKPDEPKPTPPKQDLNQKDDTAEEEKQDTEGNVATDISKASVATQKEILLAYPQNKEETNEVEEKADESEKNVSPELPAPEKAAGNTVEEMQEPGKEANADLQLGNKAEEEEKARTEDPADKDTNKEVQNEEVEREHLLNMDGLQEDQDAAKEDANQGEQEEDQENPNDYNGDEGNEAEPEADKQAQLIDNDQNLKDDDKLPKMVNGQSFDQEGEGGDDPTF